MRFAIEVRCGRKWELVCYWSSFEKAIADANSRTNRSQLRVRDGGFDPATTAARYSVVSDKLVRCKGYEPYNKSKKGTDQ